MTERALSRADNLFEVRDHIFDALFEEISSLKDLKIDSPSFLSPMLKLLEESSAVSQAELVSIITTVSHLYSVCS